MKKEQIAKGFFFPNDNWIRENFFDKHFYRYFPYIANQLESSIYDGLYKGDDLELQRAIVALGRRYYVTYGYYIEGKMQSGQREKCDLLNTSGIPSPNAHKAIELLQDVIEERVVNKIQKSDNLETKVKKLSKLLKQAKNHIHNEFELFNDIEEALMEIDINKG